MGPKFCKYRSCEGSTHIMMQWCRLSRLIWMSKASAPWIIIYLTVAVANTTHLEREKVTSLRLESLTGSQQFQQFWCPPPFELLFPLLDQALFGLCLL